ncbi:MAG TPA: acyl carrier protein [Blastocatellia bacterium]|nr:acyl carrier protein [Blastocatellia bacterium]
MDNKARIKEFLARFFRVAELRDQDDIFALGFVNSLFAMQLVMFIESEFGVGVEDEDLEIANFNTVDHINAFVARKRMAAGA